MATMANGRVSPVNDGIFSKMLNVLVLYTGSIHSKTILHLFFIKYHLFFKKIIAVSLKRHIQTDLSCISYKQL